MAKASCSPWQPLSAPPGMVSEGRMVGRLGAQSMDAIGGLPFLLGPQLLHLQKVDMRTKFCQETELILLQQEPHHSNRCLYRRSCRVPFDGSFLLVKNKERKKGGRKRNKDGNGRKETPGLDVHLGPGVGRGGYSEQVLWHETIVSVLLFTLRVWFTYIAYSSRSLQIIVMEPSAQPGYRQTHLPTHLNSLHQWFLSQ